MSSTNPPPSLRNRTGLPLSSYFSSLNIRWILDHVDGARALAGQGDALFGNIDTFLDWQLTGGPRGGLHVTDVTNASRTQLMHLDLLEWDDELLAAFDIPRAMLLTGAFLGAVAVWIHYLPHWALTGDRNLKLGTFCTFPAVRHIGANLTSEVIGTFVLTLVAAAIFSARVSETGVAACRTRAESTDWRTKRPRHSRRCAGLRGGTRHQAAGRAECHVEASVKRW